MKIKTYLFIILLILIASSLSVFLLFNYMDPEKNIEMSMASMAISSLLMFTTFYGFLLLAFKKIYYRGELYIYHIYSSLRQGFLLASYTLCCVAFIAYGVLTYPIVLITGFLLLFLELILDTLLK